jgi:hypothetical protein
VDPRADQEDTKKIIFLVPVRDRTPVPRSSSLDRRRHKLYSRSFGIDITPFPFSFEFFWEGTR